MRFLLPLTLIIAFSLQGHSQQVAETTEYFSFYNNYWINLHHFLYQKASGSQLRKLQADGLEFRDIGESQVELNDEETKAYDRILTYYQENLADKNLRRELGGMRLWFQEQDQTGLISDTSFSQEFTELLNRFSPVYREKYWPIHEALNYEVLESHMEYIRQFEGEVIGKMEELAQYKWPGDANVRVDLTVYANYAGAYTATRPKMNIIISTIDPLNNTSSFEETVFHEGSHLLFNLQDSPFRGEIYTQAENRGMEFPKNLWHAAMFYLSGRATQDAMQQVNINHQMDMDVRNIFSSYNTPEFRESLEKYYLGQATLAETVSELLDQLEK